VWRSTDIESWSNFGAGMSQAEPWRAVGMSVPGVLATRVSSHWVEVGAISRAVFSRVSSSVAMSCSKTDADL